MEASARADCFSRGNTSVMVEVLKFKGTLARSGIPRHVPARTRRRSGNMYIRLRIGTRDLQPRFVFRV